MLHLDSGLGLSISSLENTPSGDEEAGNTVQLPICKWFLTPIQHQLFATNPLPRYPPNRVRLESLSVFSTTTPYAGLRLSALDTPRIDYDEEEEYVTLGVMTLQRGSAHRCPGDSREDPISGSP